jgi:hypothetical protein
MSNAYTRLKYLANCIVLPPQPAKASIWIYNLAVNTNLPVAFVLYTFGDPFLCLQLAHVCVCIHSIQLDPKRKNWNLRSWF